MRPDLRLLPLTAALALGALPLVQDDTPDLREQLRVQAEQLEAGRVRLERLERWAEAQVAAEEAFVAATQAAGEAGFTAGINPRSREILLEAWAARAAASGKGLAGEAPAPEEGRRRGRRR